jgi:saccharopine dehydrogenase-like NADP-dependent oxidoreductase
MKVLILGGYGVFGGRLARLLLQDGVEVVVAGRDEQKAAAFTRNYGGNPLRVDIARDLSPIAKSNPGVVVDAAGPFQAYGDDPYRVPRFCVEHGINYLDLSDDAEFTAGIADLNQAAVDKGCFVLSGVSSVPAISAAVVRTLSERFSELFVIETALVPGNRAPRGRSVIASILSQTGEPLRVWRGGAWRLHRGWSEAKTVSFGQGFKRRVNLIGAPDLKLFPKAFGARSVIFRAGLELSIMDRALAFLGALRSRRLLPKLTLFLAPVLWMSRRLEPFGSDRGAMAVDVTGLEEGKAKCRRWQIIAYKGDGPFIPAVPARAVIRKHSSMQPGARPCLFDLSLPEIESAMAGLSVKFATSSSGAPTLFQHALGDKWEELPASVGRLHSVQDVEDFFGKATVTRGTSLFARCAAWFFTFPRAGENVPVTITKARTACGEIWERNFGGRKFRSYLSPSPQPFHYRERFFAFTYEQELPVEEEGLFLPVRRGWFLGIPLPKFLLPKSKAREYDAGGVFHFDVGLYAPFDGGLIVRYQGHVERAVPAPGSRTLKHEGRM